MAHAQSELGREAGHYRHSDARVHDREPASTRAEATDVANAILDGTDCVMLSEESAMGMYPVEATSMLARIAATTEPYRPAHHTRETLRASGPGEPVVVKDLIALSVETTVERIAPVAILFLPIPEQRRGTSLATGCLSGLSQ